MAGLPAGALVTAGFAPGFPVGFGGSVAVHLGLRNEHPRGLVRTAILVLESVLRLGLARAFGGVVEAAILGS